MLGSLVGNTVDLVGDADKLGFTGRELGIENSYSGEAVTGRSYSYSYSGRGEGENQPNVGEADCTFLVGSNVGSCEGLFVGLAVVGETGLVGDAVVLKAEGRFEGRILGKLVGTMLGEEGDDDVGFSEVGKCEGLAEDNEEGDLDDDLGFLDGEADGSAVGKVVGKVVGN